jgi:hypothetical protein
MVFDQPRVVRDSLIRCVPAPLLVVRDNAWSAMMSEQDNFLVLEIKSNESLSGHVVRGRLKKE